MRNQEAENLAGVVGSTTPAINVSLNKFIPQSVYENLPEPLNVITERFDGREKDIILLSSIGVISACLPNVYGIYDSRINHPNLNVFVIAPPASGKGVMSWSKKLIDPIHENLVSESKRKIVEYRRNSQSNQFLEEPRVQLKIIPGNTSSSKIYDHLENADDSLLIFETEADSLSNMLKQDWGDFSDLLRKCYHHETVSISRQTGDRLYEIKNPKLSVVVSGTPNQVKPLIDSRENGLFSRFIYYYFDEVSGWKDVSPRNQTISYDEIFGNESFGIKRLYNKLKTIPKVEVRMDDSQWDLFQEKMILADGIIQATNKFDFMPVVRRLANMTFRIIMILSIMRNKENISENNRIIYARDEDVISSLELLKILIDHSLNIFDKYDKKSIQLTMSERNLLSRLPENFKRGEGLEIAVVLGFPERTYDETLKKWERKKVIQKVSHGVYQKNQIN